MAEDWKKICGCIIMNGKNKGKTCRRPNKYKIKLKTSSGHDYVCGLHRKCYESHWSTKKIEKI